MNPTPSSSPESLQEILAGYALGDLSPEEMLLLDGLDRDWVASQMASLHQAVAQCTLATATPLQPMPLELEARLRQQIPSQLTSARPMARSRDWTPLLVLAASLILVMVLWGNQFQSTKNPLVSSRDFLLQQADTLKIDWSNGTTPFPNTVQGDVVWSTSQQKGYMRFVGLPANDPSKEQYQLWIIDPARDDEPIDGGIFDIHSDGETIIPIDPKLQVLQPAAFAITVEKPGGVVVSTQERLPLLAKAPAR